MCIIFANTFGLKIIQKKLIHRHCINFHNCKTKESNPASHWLPIRHAQIWYLVIGQIPTQNGGSGISKICPSTWFNYMPFCVCCTSSALVANSKESAVWRHSRWWYFWFFCSRLISLSLIPDPETVLWFHWNNPHITTLITRVGFAVLQIWMVSCKTHTDGLHVFKCPTNCSTTLAKMKLFFLRGIHNTVLCEFM